MSKSQIESLLFISNRSIKIKELAELTGLKIEDTKNLIKELSEEYESKGKGVKIIQINQEVQIMTDPANAKIIEKFLEHEVNRELTPAALETLSIIAYRGPISRQELEQIRGINCSIILRNLLIKGLISELNKEKEIDPLKQKFETSLEFVKYLGLTKINDLPDYNKLNNTISIEELALAEE